MDAYNESKRRADMRRPKTVLGRERFTKYGTICELFFGEAKQIPEIMRIMNASHSTVALAIEKYLGRGEPPILITFDLSDDSAGEDVQHHPEPNASPNPK